MLLMNIYLFSWYFVHGGQLGYVHQGLLHGEQRYSFALGAVIRHHRVLLNLHRNPVGVAHNALQEVATKF